MLAVTIGTIIGGAIGGVIAATANPTSNTEVQHIDSLALDIDKEKQQSRLNIGFRILAYDSTTLQFVDYTEKSLEILIRKMTFNEVQNAVDGEDPKLRAKLVGRITHWFKWSVNSAYNEFAVLNGHSLTDSTD